MKVIHSFLILFIVALSVSAAEPSEAYLDLVGHADDAIARGKWADAEKSLLEAMRSDPGNPGNIMLMSNLGIVRFNMGQDSIALKTLDEAHAMAPRAVTVLENRARVLALTGKFDAAMDDYNTIVGLDSLALSPRFYRSVLAMRRGDVATARADVDVMLRHAPDSLPTLVADATLASAMRDYPRAVTAYTRLIAKDCQPEYLGERALAFMMTDRLGEAAEDLARAIEMSPDDPQLYVYRSMLNKARYRPDDAAADERRARGLMEKLKAGESDNGESDNIVR